MTSSLFPQLPERSRSRFRVGLIIVVVALAAFAVLRWQAPMIATAVFGLPVLFVIYLREIDVRHDLPVRDVVVAAVLGLGLGVGWALIVGPIVAEAYNAALGTQTDVAQVLLSGVAIPISEALLMVLPAVVVRVMDRSTRESLDGFAIGALGATVFNGAATVTLLVPQLAMGVTAQRQSVGSLLVEALVEGVAWPLASLATGGIFGIALWFTLPANASRRHRGAVLAALLVVLIVVTTMGVVDVTPTSLRLYVGLQLLIAVLAVLALRIVIAGALLHEVHDDTGDDEQLVCAECDHIVAHMAFCTDCGVATRAASRTSRAARQVVRTSPEPATGPDEPNTPLPVHAATYPGVLAPMAAGVGVAVAVGVVVAVLMTPAPEPYVCPPDCGRPPLGTPVETNPRFSGDNGAFSVSYPGEGSAYEVTFDPPGLNGVELKYVGGDTGTLTLFGEPAGDRTAKQIAQQLISSKFPGATVDYEIPNASVGYQPGFGVVADVHSHDSSGIFTRLRMIVMAAVKHEYALIAAAVGPYHEFSPDYGTGHPSGANLELAMDMGKYVNSFKWGGDRYGRPA